MSAAARITPRRLRGNIRAISSKTHAHRALVAAALCREETRLVCEYDSDDIQATIRCLEAMGARFDFENGLITVTPLCRRSQSAAPILDCGESGSSLRFLLPLAALGRTGARLTGRGRLPERPIGELRQCLAERGAVFCGEKLPFDVRGPLTSGRFVLPGGISSQYISGLLLALPLLDGDSEITLSSPLQSAGYVDITLQTLAAFGICAETPDKDKFTVAGGQRYISPGELTVEGDWSGAAFFLVAGAVGGPVSVGGLNRDSLQRDRRIVDILKHFGAATVWRGDTVTVSASSLTGFEINAADIPDLVPALAVAAAAADGRTVFYNVGRLRLKESDRLSTTVAMLNSLGASAHAENDRLVVEGGRPLRGGTVDSFGDHRIAMAAAISAGICSEDVFITEPMCVAKSYPQFFKHYIELGGEANGVDLG